MSNLDERLVELLQQLIRIPSWVSKTNPETANENALVDFLESWLKENTKFSVVRQELPGGRFNLIAKKGEPKTVFLAHTDTVHPSHDARYDQFAAEIHDGNIWGLGATDMKSGLACMLQAISIVDPDDVWLVLYADEEYDFLGMKEFVKEYNWIRPERIVSSDGSNLNLGFGCRGCIEFRARFVGKSGHAAKGNGISAIEVAMVSLLGLKKELEKYSHPDMGHSTINLGHIIGGGNMGENSFDGNHLVRPGKFANKIPDIAEVIVDIRPGVSELDQAKAIEILEAKVLELGAELEIVERTHDLGAWYTDPQQLARYDEIVEMITGATTIFDEPGNSGYLDLQMLWDAVGRPMSLMFGAGIGDTAHSSKEHIPISNLIKGRDFFVAVLKSQ